MTETVKERIYRGALETMSDSDFMGNKYVKKFVKGVFKQIEDVPVTTGENKVEKLQEQLNTAKKALTEIAEFEPKKSAHKYWPDWHSVMMATASEALAEIGNERSDDDGKRNQSQLTIPKRIADALDVGDLMFLAWTHGNDLLGKVSDEERDAECRRRNAIAKAYLAGKALGVDLVKVVEG